MGNEEISDRHHFFATACTHFRWAMLDELKKRRVDVMPDVPDIVEMPDEDIAAEREMQQLVMAELGSLDESIQRIVCGRLFLGMTFEELGREYDMPLTTAYDQFNSGIELLRRRVSQA
jgi:DNA-directed RNA polymerase specialized sigma24 family protein